MRRVGSSNRHALHALCLEIAHHSRGGAQILALAAVSLLTVCSAYSLASTRRSPYTTADLHEERR